MTTAAPPPPPSTPLPGSRQQRPPSAGAADPVAPPVPGDPATAGPGPAATIDLREVVNELAQELRDNRQADEDRATLLAVMDEERRRSRRRRLVDASAAIALLTLLFSAVAYLLEDRQSTSEANQAARAQLSELVRAINNIPIEQARLVTEIGGEQASAVGGSVAGQQLVLVSQAEAILDRHPEVGTALDYFVLGEAYARNGDHQIALEQYQEALPRPATPAVDLAVHRGLAISSFGVGDAEQGRRYFSAALDIELRHPDITTQFDEWSAITTRIRWAAAEMFARDCDRAVEQLQLLAGAAGRSSDQYLYRRPMGFQIEATIAAVESNCPSAALNISDLRSLAAQDVPTPPAATTPATTS